MQGRTETRLSRIVISRGLAQTDRGTAKLLVLLRCERGRGCLFQHFLMAALDGAITHARGPGCSEVVGNYLHLNVAGRRHKLLDENRRVAERFEGVGASAFKSPFEIGSRIDAANAMSAAASAWP